MNKKTLLFSLIISLFLFVTTFGQTNVKVNGTASKGGKIVRVSSNTEYKLMETYPVCTVTVYLSGTTTTASIFSDEIGTAKSNPFTSGTDASYSFYVAPGRYDIKFSGTGITVPFTIADVFVETGGGGGAGVDSFNGRTGVVIPVAGDYTFSGLDFTGSNFNSIATRSASDLNSGTLPDAIFPSVLPAVSGVNLTNLNATNIASGTLADGRLSSNVPLKNAANTFTNTNLFTGTAVGIGTTGPDRKLDILDASNAQLRLSAVDNSVYTDLYVDSGGTLNILPTGNVAFDSAGNQVNPLNNYDQNLGQINKKWLGLWAAELNVETLVAQNTIATIGGRIIVAPTNTLIADLAPATTTINVKYNNFNNGDRVYMESGGQVEFFAITSGASVIGGGFSYTVTRNLDGSGANQWYAGDAMVDTGVSGNGFIDLYSVNGVKSGTQLGPTIVGNVRNSSTYNDWTENWAIGNLNGIYGYGTNVFGVALGKYAASNTHLTVDPTNGIRIFNGLSTVVGQWDSSGNITVGQVGSGLSNIQITAAGQISIRNNTTARIQLNSDGSGFLASSNLAWDTSGNLTVAGGNATLDTTGLHLLEGTTTQSAVNWKDGNNFIVSLNGDLIGTGSSSDGVFLITIGNQNGTRTGLMSFSTGPSSTTANTGASFSVPGRTQVGSSINASNSAVLQVESTTAGFLPPRMTTTERDAISSPAAGLVIYNTSTNKHQGYNGSTWNDMY